MDDSLLGIRHQEVCALSSLGGALKLLGVFILLLFLAGFVIGGVSNFLRLESQVKDLIMRVEVLEGVMSNGGY